MNSFTLILMSLSFLLTSCKFKTEKSEAQSAGGAVSGMKPAIFAFDGSTFNRESGSVVSQFLYGVALPQERIFYYPGVSLEGSEAYVDVERALQDLCKGLSERAFNSVFVTGLSRGAIEAVAFVNRAEKRCNQKVPFFWVGLVDPVNTTIEDLPTVMPGGAEIPCILIRKKKNFEHIFTTKMIGLCNTAVVNVPDFGHADISFNRDVANALLLTARELGRNALRVYGEPSSEFYRPILGQGKEASRCASFQGEAQECLAAKCEYDLQGGICRPSVGKR